MQIVILSLLALISISIAAHFDNQTQAIVQGYSYLQRDAYFEAEDYLFDYTSEGRANEGLRVVQQYGSIALMQIPQIPSLIGTSLGSSRFDLKPCALLQPHTHRADVQIYILKGKIRAGKSNERSVRFSLEVLILC